MLLTITYSGTNATDLGFLLHKNPVRPQVFDVSHGKAYVFYTETKEKTCTAALLLDINPLELARGKEGSKVGGLFDYVNDRPYVSSSFMSTAISRVFGTAMSGRCDRRQELADSALGLVANLTMLPCRGDTTMLERVFVPLGYDVEFTTSILDERNPGWGDSRYVNLKLSGTIRLRDMLSHLYVLIPVFDLQKHYWVGREEVEKLLRHGEGWLNGHPEREFIARRYFDGRYRLVRMAMDRLDNGEGGAMEEETSQNKPSLNTRRLDAVLEALKESGARSVVDMGCGEGNLLELLAGEKTFVKIAGTDVSRSALERASQRLNLDELPDGAKGRFHLFQSSLTYKDDRMSGYDAAAVVEVIEHLDVNRLFAFESVLFAEARPATIVLTTPNVEYNENYDDLTTDNMRHRDHRFEWNREQFKEWCGKMARTYVYTVVFKNIGDEDDVRGTPTQMGVFTKCE